MKIMPLLPILLISFSPAAFGAVTLTVLKSDGVTPLGSETILEGCRLVVIVESDAGEEWCGGVFLTGANRGLGILSARGYDPNSNVSNCMANGPHEWKESRTVNAGTQASVIAFQDSFFRGFDLQASSDGGPGQWFVLDYLATGAGSPDVEFYDYSVSITVPVHTVPISQAMFSDLTNDSIVNYFDFSVLESAWMQVGCTDPEWCNQADLDRNGRVDIADLTAFSCVWMWTD